MVAVADPVQVTTARDTKRLTVTRAEPAWESYVAELYRLGDLLQLVLNDQARCDHDDDLNADTRMHSTCEIVRDRLSSLANRIEVDGMG